MDRAILEQEAVWREQFTPPALLWLAEQLRDRYGRGPNDIGSPGDSNHLRGGHRSRDWILRSQWCTSRTYTVTHADDRLGDRRWYCAIDIGGMSQAELIAMCRRLDAAVRAGLLEECWEWYGNLGGDTRVDGWNNLEDRLASSDSSHLYHLHMTFRRRWANDLAVMQRAATILIGDDMADSPQLTTVNWRMLEGVIELKDLVDDHVNDAPQVNQLARTLKGIQASLAASAVRESSTLAGIQAAQAAIQALAAGGGVDAAPILAAVDRVGDELGGRIAALEADLAAERAENHQLRAQLAAAYATPAQA